jgi:ferrous iron transport protein A
MDTMDHQPQVLTLADLLPGQQGQVIKIDSLDKTFKRRMSSLGVIPGGPVALDRAAPLGDPRIYVLMGYNLGLRNAEARMIQVRITS